MPVPTGPGPHTFSRRVGPWQVHLHAHQGRVRRRIEDAWAVVEAVSLGPHIVDAFAVFDGLGGVPNGQEAAWAAADRLEETLARVNGPQEILPALNDVVRPTGGSTTATLLLVARDPDPAHGHRAWIASIGDSSIYRRDADGFRRLNQHDRRDRHVLSDWLGRNAAQGHLQEVLVGPEAVHLLCTDGVDEVAGEEALRDAAETTREETPRGLDGLFARIDAAGAPDNATVLVVHRA